MSRDAFGPNLRRIRVQQQITLEQIAAATRLPAQLLDGLERNDFTDWPEGLFARAYVRQYAEALGIDPVATVDDFCRWFPQGDRRAERLIRDHADIVGHQLEWQDDLPFEGPDRRGASEAQAGPQEEPSTGGTLFMRVRRVFEKA
jgi:transcriptional regulator with XRE-family HTH domain